MSPAKKLALVKNSPARAPADTDKPTSILDQRFRYRSSAETDLRARFKAMGWKPPKPKKPQFGK
jgi:hypothetical protein